MPEISALPAPQAQKRAGTAATAPPGPDRGTLELSGADQVKAFQDAAWAPNTRAGYQGDWTAFTTWCQEQNLQALPAAPLTVATYLATRANLVDEQGNWFYAPATLSRWLAAINKAHGLAGYPKPGADPTVATTIAGIRRERARPESKKAPLVLSELKRALAAIDINTWPAGVIGHRDRLILLLGFAGAFRRSELVALNLSDITPHEEDGLHIRLLASKTDQEGRGATKGIPYGANPATCPPCAYARWLRVVAAAETGRPALLRVLHAASTDQHICREPYPELDQTLPLIRPVRKNGTILDNPVGGEVINAVVQRRVRVAGMNSVRYGAHSLRAGFVTEAFRSGATHHEVMRQTGHRSVATVEGYSREHDPLRHNAVTRIGL